MNILFSVIGILIFTAGIGLHIWQTIRHQNGDCEKPAPIVRLIAMILAGVVLFTVGLSIVIIPTNYTGVKTVFGQIDEKPLPQGLNFKIPFVTKVEKVNNKLQDVTVATGDTLIGGETSARTQVYYGKVTVTYKINPDYATWIYTNVTNYKENLISENLVSNALKAMSKKLPDETATDRNVINGEAKIRIQQLIDEKYVEGAITVTQVNIGDADFDESYNTAVAEKQNAKLAYEKQQIENKKAIEEAEAQAEVKKKQAQGKADAAIIEAEGEKKANKLLEESLNDKIIKNKAVEKWNGKLPQVMGENGVLIDLEGDTK